MGRLAKRIEDKEVLRLIRRYLQAGMLVNGLVVARDEGTPQGGPLSPLLANGLLDEVDKQLEQRGHHFVRYADDLNVYVGSKRAGERVMQALKGMYDKLKLQVNDAKSAVAPVGERKFLGFTLLVSQGQPYIAVAAQSVEKFKIKVRTLTSRVNGRSMAVTIHNLNIYLRGWYGYFGKTEHPYTIPRLAGWVRRRPRCLCLKQWKHGKGIYRGLRKLGVNPRGSREVAAYAGRWWWLSANQTNTAPPNTYFDQLGACRSIPTRS